LTIKDEFNQLRNPLRDHSSKEIKIFYEEYFPQSEEVSRGGVGKTNIAGKYYRGLAFL
jgi:hypothetical protein